MRSASSRIRPVTCSGRYLRPAGTRVLTPVIEFGNLMAKMFKYCIDKHKAEGIASI
jgi:hypothetical protein